MHPSAFRLPPSALLALILAMGGLPASGQSLLKSHGHNNLPVLQKLTAPGGVLTYDGSAVGGSVTLAGTPDYITISGSTITRAAVNLTSHVTGTLPVANGGTGITALGTGIATALGVNVGSAGAPVLFNGAGGTPSSITLTNGTGLPASGVTGTALTLSGGTLTGQLIQSLNGAASTPPLAMTGTWFTGGSATTTKPQLLIEPTGTTSTGWSTSGTGIGVNAPSGFVGDVMALQVNAVPVARAVMASGAGKLQVAVNSNSGGIEVYHTTYTGNRAVSIVSHYGAPLVALASTGSFTWSSGADAGTGGNTSLYQDAAATIQMGADAAAAIHQGFKSHDGSGTDKAGANLSLGGGQSTGTGRGGDVIIKTAHTSTTGNTANSHTTRQYHAAKWVDLTETTATTFANIAVASGKYSGAVLVCTVNASDGTDHQCLTSTVNLNAINKAGTVTATITQVDGTTAASAGTLTVTFTAVTSGNTVDIKADATSSLTQTQLRIKWAILSLNTDSTDTSLVSGSTVTPQ